MNQDNAYRNIIYSHRVLNYLNASFQGKFAALNILSQFDHPDFKDQDIQTTRDTLLVIRRWMDLLLENRFLLFEDREQNQEGQKAVQMLHDLIPELTDLSMETKKILVSDESLSHKENCVFLIAALGRSTYAKDNYVRGFVKFGKQIGDQELVEQYSQGMKNISIATQLVTDLVNCLKTSETIERHFLKYIEFSCRMLPGVFRAHCHDIKQLICGPKRPFNFLTAGFTKAEIKAWHEAGFDAYSAGYWRAHEIHAAEALLWAGVDIIDAEMASEWKTAGYTPGFASLWLEVGFAPSLAIMWERHGFSPDVARDFYDQGYQTPEDIPNEVLQQHFPELFSALGKDEEQGEVAAADSQEGIAVTEDQVDPSSAEEPPDQD